MNLNGNNEKPSTAEDEYKKDPKIKKEDIEELRKWARMQPDLPFNISEKELICFYHSCYYNIENAKSCMKNYYSIRSNSPEFFSKRDIDSPELKHINTVVYFGCLPVRDPKGNQIIFHKLKKFDSGSYIFDNSVKSLFMAFEGCTHQYGTVPGYALLFDMKGVGLFHLMRLSISSLRKMLVYQQEGMPIRLKTIHVMNTNSLMSKIMFMMKPFMNKELIEMIHFHTEMEPIYEIFTKDCLPSDYGGNLDSCDALHEQYIEHMRSLKTFFEKEEANLAVKNSDNPLSEKEALANSIDGLTIH
ncbi:alpha-tocopherol transfer protein-like [Nilaparvata lugens]|uniref:alpha-tocopherol transfer protein-like n=1 Tax=Nilaparvata lugens TaxID=108931 RepID=UPI000B984661|nr:alpha-tocopherol transfer protein-like [Nilaparvata lugens]XP_039290189.1 alpha-tocopherol transfer protein-like [Nilaparvata lugens]XP_039290190.1 alpha-tocopherol transfer protein-like [Nilaparvata lugens]XP_039290191.1 alpha-tocopherol transfer protein-like [Nilaparvata lugens]XP_039290192.1 alpha-tocopherol transfer protein-like [Nilaparvata lugens]